jgi:hypothetical protein
MTMPPWILTMWTWMTWLFEKGLAAWTTAWNTSRKATEIAIVGAVIFCALMYFGFVRKPNVTPELSKEVMQLTQKIDALQKSMATKDDISFIEGQIATLDSKIKPKVTARRTSRAKASE